MNLLLAMQAVIEPGFGQGKTPVHGWLRYSQQFSGFLGRATKKDTVFQNRDRIGERLGEFFERAVQVDHLFARRVHPSHLGAQRHTRAAAAAFSRVARPRLIHQNLAHQSGRESKEVRAIGPGGLGLLRQAQEYFVHDAGRIEDVSTRFPSHIGMGQLAKVLIHQRHQLILRGTVTFSPAQQQRGYVGGHGSPSIVGGAPRCGWPGWRRNAAGRILVHTCHRSEFSF